MKRCRGDEGSITVWTLGAVVVLGFFGWMTLDLSTSFAARRELAGAADQAAQAGAAQLDVATWRASGIRQLDPARARTVALDTIGAQGLDNLSNVDVSATPAEVTVVLEADVTSGLITIFGAGDGDLHITVRATGIPRGDVP